MGWIPHEFCPNSYHTKFIPWDGFHLFKGKNNTHLHGLNFINPERRYFSKPNGNVSTKPSEASNDTCCPSSSCLRLSSTQSRMRSRCLKNAFQTPSSTSCMRSTVSMLNMLKPNGASLLENAFWQSMSIETNHHMAHTAVGTRERSEEHTSELQSP